MINKNKLFRQIHIYVSLFFLPLALLYAISGIAYILGADQDTGADIKSYTLKTLPEQGKEQDFVLNFLKENGLKIPSNTNLKMNAKSKELTMGASHYSVSLSIEKSTLTTKTRSILGDMIMLHKNKGEWYFSILGIGFGIALMLLYLSGLIITLFAIKKDRDKQIAVLVCGIAITLILGYLSL
ncbi:hypothetical protein [Campylobacter sp. US33a]|uniref:Integral membrane protein n=1 Tax=Campylobacter sp. CCS1377 TaxID=3158229 RepID=A0AAU7E5M6_9BACT|nr:hypothetical protein [Campylobacter sp. US33a]MCW1361017.1 hypothetical protein [Campylobacter jejuni]TEY02039.1 hypothetical protein ELQ16_06710 [Campylobacter sp. US33a]